MVSVADKAGEAEGISKMSYRVVINCGTQGGQIAPHVHMHLLGGRKLADERGTNIELCSNWVTPSNPHSNPPLQTAPHHDADYESTATPDSN